MNTNELAILWLVRKYEPIRVAELQFAFQAKKPVTHLKGEPLVNVPIQVTQMIQWVRENHSLGIIQMGFWIKSLALNNLIGIYSSAECQDEYSLTELELTGFKAYLKTRPYLSGFLSTFGISLTKQLSQFGYSQLAYPIFGEPLSNHSDWADVFVMMPFRDDLQHVFSDNIKRITDELHVTCKRGDDFFTTNDIMSEVWSSVVHASICIAECTGRNPNVFYEIGIAHTIGRKTILIAQSMDDVPFDVRHLRVIIYENTADGLAALRDKLKAMLEQELGF